MLTGGFKLTHFYAEKFSIISALKCGKGHQRPKFENRELQINRYFFNNVSVLFGKSRIYFWHKNKLKSISDHESFYPKID